jgi:DnaJ-class molecular chaperone
MSIDQATYEALTARIAKLEEEALAEYRRLSDAHEIVNRQDSEIDGYKARIAALKAELLDAASYRAMMETERDKALNENHDLHWKLGKYPTVKRVAREKCPICRGEKIIRTSTMPYDCPTCNGKGEVGMKCPDCDGEGKPTLCVNGKDMVVKCPTCDGSGEIGGAS